MMMPVSSLSTGTTTHSYAAAPCSNMVADRFSLDCIRSLCTVRCLPQWLLQQRGGAEASVRWGRTLNELLQHAVMLCRPSCIAAGSEVCLRLQARLTAHLVL